MAGAAQMMMLRPMVAMARWRQHQPNPKHRTTREIHTGAHPDPKHRTRALTRAGTPYPALLPKLNPGPSTRTRA